MSCKISAEKYNNLPALYANAGKWIDGEFNIKNDFYAGSGESNKIISLGDTLTVQFSQWSDFGFVVGDVLTLSWSSFVLPIGAQTATRTITYINGNIIYIDSALPSPFTNVSFPESGVTTGMSVKAIKQPQSIEFTFNLTKDGVTSQDSIIDGELNRFIYNSVQSMAVLATASMVQLGNKSGGIIKNVVLTRLADTTASVYSYSNYKVTFKFMQYGLFEDANLYGAASCLTPFIKAITLPLSGNPNGKQTDTNGAKEANTGYFGENYNGGANPYIFNSISWLDSLGNSIPKLDYSNECTFTATLTTPDQLNATSVYRIGLGFTPVTDALYKNLLTSEENNLLINAPEVNFLHSAVSSPTVYTGAINSDGVGYNLTDLKFSHAAGVLTVSGKVVPNVANIAFFDDLADGERNIIMWVQVSNHALTGVLNDEVNVLIYNNDCFDAPAVGVQYPNIVKERLFDIADQNITSSAFPNTTTEDNLLYITDIQLPTNTIYEGIRCAISAKNNITGESFELESNFFDFGNVPYVSGKYQLNETINRPFNISPLSNRNKITLELNALNDAVGLYGVKLSYAFMNDWRYWVSDSSVDNDFFDLAQPNNGLNKNWQRFQNGEWDLNIDFYVRKDGIEDFNHLPYINRPYEDDPSVTATETFTGSNATVATNLLSNDLQTLAVTFAWNQLFDAEWVEITIEDYESGNRWIRNSLEDIGNIAGCPIKPIIGQTKVSLVNGGMTLTASVLIDTNLLNAQNVSLTYRVYSNPRDSIGYMITLNKDASFAIGLRKLSNDSVYSGALIEVTRDSDNATMDIGHIDGNLDTAALLTFAGVETVFISKYYSQNGDVNAVTQTDKTKMDTIVLAGILIVDPTNGVVAARRQLNTEYDLPVAISTSVDSFTTHVLTRLSTSDSIVGLGNEADQKYTLYWASFAVDVNNIRTGLGASPILYTADSGTGNVLLTTIHGSNQTDLYFNGFGSHSSADVFQNNLFTKINRANGISGSGLFQEMVLWNKDKSAQRVVIETNIVDYYGL